MVLTNRSAIYIYFDLIKQLEPKRILDIGMFLKRTGSVSRKMMARQVPESVILDGIDFFPEMNFPVWNNIYNRVLDEHSFFGRQMDGKYDCAFFLGMKEYPPGQGWLSSYLWADWTAKLSEKTRYLLSDQEAGGDIHIKVGEDTFYLLDFGE